MKVNTIVFFFICEMLSICYAAVTMKNGRQLEK